MTRRQGRAWRLALLLGAVAAAAVLVLRQQPRACGAPEVRLQFDPAAAAVHHFMSIEQLSAQHAAGSETHTLGRYNSQVSLAISGQVLSSRSMVRAAACVTQMDVTVELEHDIHIVSELPERSCAYEQALEHERDHERRQVQAVESLLSDLAQSASRLRPSSTDGASSPQALLEQVRQQLQTPFAEQLQRTAAASHAQIDTPEEYARALQGCDQQVRELLAP